jgi:hypothetical protein
VQYYILSVQQSFRKSSRSTVVFTQENETSKPGPTLVIASALKVGRGRIVQVQRPDHHTQMPE